MTFFLSSSASTSTTTSLSSSPLRRLDSDDSDDDGNESLRHQRSDDIPTTQSGFTMFGLLSRRIDYISGASASDLSSLEESSESEGESSWTRRATLGDGDGEDRNASTRIFRSTREDARSPSRRCRSPDIHDVHEPSAGTSKGHVNQTIGRTSASEPNFVPSTNQVEEEEPAERRRRRRRSSPKVYRNTRREVTPRKRHDSRIFFEGFICTLPKKFQCLAFNFLLYVNSLQHEIFSSL